MANKRWKKEENKHVLIFTPFYDDERMLFIYRESEEERDWYITSGMLGLNDEFLCEGICTEQEAKQEAEDMVLEYLGGQAGYYSSLVKSFKEE